MEPTAVDAVFETVSRDFQKHANLPGFRPGKAPREMILKRYDEDIQKEAKKKLMSESYRQAIAEKKFEVVGYPDIEEIQFGRGQSMQFAATIETAPQFELPDYKSLPARREKSMVTDADIEKALQALREQQTQYNTVQRPVQKEDLVVVNYRGTSEGKPLTEIAPTAKGLTEQKNFWIEVTENSFIPGFGMQLLGTSAGDKKTVEIDFPADFVTPQLSGKKGHYEVEIVEVKEKTIPAIDEAFAKIYDAESLEKLREGVRADLQNELNFKQNKSIRHQLVQGLLQRVQCDLPESVVLHETKEVVYNIVHENQKKGVPKELIDEKKDEIFATAQATARERVKAGFVFRKIAEREGIKVSQPEIAGRVQQLAASYQMPPEKLIKELEKRNGLSEIYEQVMSEKVIDLLQQYARIEDQSPSAPA